MKAGIVISAFLTLVGAEIPAKDLAIRTFSRSIRLDNGDSAGISMGDLNGDGSLDIVLAKGRHSPAISTVFLNDGKAHFVAKDLGVRPNRTFGAAMADLDRDGDLDIVLSNDLPDPKLIYTNNGDGTFADGRPWGEPSWPTRYATLADLNGDGYADIIAANAGARLPLPIPYPTFMCLNDRQGMFPVCKPIPSESAVRVVAGDFDGDGAVDVFVPHRDGGSSFLLWNDGKAFVERTSFRSRTQVGSSQAAIHSAASGDLDGDGQLDLVVCDMDTKTTTVFYNQGNRIFRKGLVLREEGVPYAVTVADLNRDGKLDIIVGHLSSPGAIYFNNGARQKFVKTSWNDGKGEVYEIAVGDLDGDGWPDIAVAQMGTAAVWFNGS